jgi:alkaline phosphatase D
LVGIVLISDDHDFGANNQGNDYICLTQSQNEFAIHFNLNESDPRHPSQGANQRHGVYSSNMFSKPSITGGGNGVHVINLDARTGRDATFSSYGTCKGAASQMLDDQQWTWLDAELSRPSVVKVIGSGTQVLPPTDQSRSLSSYCAYDGIGGTFENSIAALDEGAALGTGYESWGEMPQERLKLLQKCQKAINDGFAKVHIFPHHKNIRCGLVVIM